jgi:hypothetical protein
MLWVPTRFATLKFLAKAPGDLYYFDLMVEGYPDVDDHAIANILQTLHQTADVPYVKWVATATVRPLEAAEPDDLWNKIVDRLGVMPSQFANDSFWRLQTGRPNVGIEAGGSAGHTLGARSYFIIHEPDRLRLSVTTYTAQGTVIPERTLDTTLAANAPIATEGPAHVPLRPYTTQPLVLRATRSDLLDDRRTTIRLSTAPDDGGWASGPNTELEVRVRKKVWKLVVGGLLISIGGLVGLKNLVDAVGTHSILGIGLTIIGGLLVAGGLQLLTGKFALKV